MAFTLRYILVLLCMMGSAAANAAMINWTPTNKDVNFIYTTVSGFSLAMFDVNDFDTSKSNPLLLNTSSNVDTISIAPSTGTDYTAASSVTSNAITLFNDNQFVLALTDGTNWYEPTVWFEVAANSNIYNITFSNGTVTSIDAVPSAVPVPAAVILFVSGLLGMSRFAKLKA